METSQNEQTARDEGAMRAELRNTIEHLETAIEELKASEQKATSMNEALESTNEDLRAANSQLQHKITELERATNILGHLLAGSDTSTLFLDNELAISWIAPATKELFDFTASDIGRPIADFTRQFSDENLLRDAETVLRTLTTIEAEVLNEAGRWHLRRMLPYRTRDNQVLGIVVSFNDITERRIASDAVNEAKIYSEAIIATVRQPLVVLDSALRVQSANAAFYGLFQAKSQETEGNLIYSLGNRQWDIPSLRAFLNEVMAKGQTITDYEVEHDFPDIGRRCIVLNARKLLREGGRDALILLAIEDITERRYSEKVVRTSEQRMKDLIRALPGAVYTTDAQGRITSYNPAAVELWGRIPELGTETWCGSWKLYQPDGTPLPHDQCPMAIALKEQKAIQGAEAAAERPDGGMVPFLTYPTPLFDASGKVTGAVNMLVDITERKRSEELALRLAAIVESSDDAIISKGLGGKITSWNDGAQRLFGYTAKDIIGKSIMMLIPENRREEEKNILDKIRRGEHIQHYETVRRRADGSGVWVSLTISPIKNASGLIIGASKVARDITERKRADQHRRTLMDELNHRVKNTLAVIQSIASQTLGHAASLDEAREAFGARLLNLATAHDTLTRESWQSATLADIVSDTIKPHAGGPNRFRVEGPDIRLTPTAALAVSMAVNELGTNAAKYGALCSESGHVAISWRIEGEGDDRRLLLLWKESGGPPVVPPTRRGFGSRLIERALASELDAEVSVSYDTSGLVCMINAPLPIEEAIGGSNSHEPVKTRADIGR